MCLRALWSPRAPRARGAVPGDAVPPVWSCTTPGRLGPPSHLPGETSGTSGKNTVSTISADLPIHAAPVKSEGRPAPATFVERVGDFERALIVHALDRAQDVQMRAACELGMTDRHLRYKLRKCGLGPAPKENGLANLCS